MGKVLKLCVCTCRHVHVQMCSPVHATYISAPMRIISEQETQRSGGEGTWRGVMGPHTSSLLLLFIVWLPLLEASIFLPPSFPFKKQVQPLEVKCPFGWGISNNRPNFALSYAHPFWITTFVVYHLWVR